LEEGEEDGHGNCTDHDTGGKLSPLDFILAGHVQEAGRQGPHFGATRERGGEEQLAPGGHEGKDGSGSDPRCRQGHDDPEQGAEPGRAVDHGTLLQLARDTLEVTHQHPDREWHGEGEVGIDQRLIRVDQTQGIPLGEQGRDKQNGGEHLGGQEDQHQGVLSDEPETRQGVAGRCGDHDGGHRGDRGDPQAVGEEAAEWGEPGGPRLHVVLKGGKDGDVRDRGGVQLCSRLEGCREGPEERPHGKECHDRQSGPEDRAGQDAFEKIPRSMFAHSDTDSTPFVIFR